MRNPDLLYIKTLITPEQYTVLLLVFLYLRSSSCTLVSYNQDPKPPETTILLLSQRTQPGLDTPWGSGGRASMAPAFVKIVLGCNLQAGNIMCLTNCQYYLNTACLNLLTVFVSKMALESVTLFEESKSYINKNVFYCARKIPGVC